MLLLALLPVFLLCCWLFVDLFVGIGVGVRTLFVEDLAFLTARLLWDCVCWLLLYKIVPEKKLFMFFADPLHKSQKLPDDLTLLTPLRVALVRCWLIVGFLTGGTSFVKDPDVSERVWWLVSGEMAPSEKKNLVYCIHVQEKSITR